MQNRIDRLFEIKKSQVLSVFFTAGYPGLNDTIRIIEALDRSEADIIEIGIPFSDPIADGPVIQESSKVALENGMSLELLFAQLKNLRNITQKPVVLMGYLNSVLQYGTGSFYRKCSEVGIDGLILPDLPIDEYKNTHQAIADRLNIKVSFLVSPDTKPERIGVLDEISGGFLYLLSSNSTTGGEKGISEKLKNVIREIKKPVLIGFGIKGSKEFSEASEIANGAIIGSAFIQLLAGAEDYEKDIMQFTVSVKHKTVII